MRQIEKLRRWRGGRDWTVALPDEVARLQKEVERSGRRLASFVSAWEQVIPPDLVAHTRVKSVRGGVVQVVASSSGVLYELDRLLRGGAEAEIRQRLSSTLTRVKVTVGPVDVADGRASSRGRGSARSGNGSRTRR